MVLALDVHMKTAVVVPLLAIAMVARASAQDPQSTVALIGGQFAYEVKAGDTLEHRRPFRRDRGRPRRDESAHPALAHGALLIDNTHIAALDPGVKITINIPQRMLFVADAERVVAYPVTVGRRTWPTPTGEFTVIGKETDPCGTYR